MRTPNPTLKNRRREEILKVAAELFAGKNFHEVKMTDVAERVKIAKGSLYLHFKSKEELYISIITVRLEALLQMLKERFDRRQSPLTNLRRIIVHTYSFMCKYEYFFHIWYREKLNCSRSSHREIRHVYQEIKNLLASVLEEGIRSRYFHDQPVERLVDWILGLVDAAVLRGLQLNTADRREERVLLYEFVLRSIGTPSAWKQHQAGEDEPAIEELNRRVFV